MSELILRPMDPADMPQVHAVGDAGYGPGIETQEAFEAKCLVGTGLVIANQQEILAYGVALPLKGQIPTLHSIAKTPVTNPKYMFVHDVCVREDARKYKLGTQIMHAFEAETLRMGLHVMRCVAVNGAEEVWRKLGWIDSAITVPRGYPKPNRSMVKIVK